MVKFKELKKSIIKILKIIIPLGIGVYLTWYFYSGLTQEEKDDIPVAFANANYLWVFLSLVIAWLSHFSRAYRWKFMMEPLGYKPKISSLYHSVMIGYVINFTVPRSGEIARAGFFSKKEGVPFDKTFGTIVAERVIDLVMLGLITILTYFLVGQDSINEMMKGNGDSSGGSSWILYAILAVGVTGILLLVIFKKLRTLIFDKVKGVFDGIKTVFQLKKRGFFILHTLIIWFCYIAMFWVFGLSFESIGMLDAPTLFSCFFVGSAAIAVTPGGIGLFPLFVAAALKFGEYPDSSSFAIMLWVVQTVFLVVFGLYSIFAINVKFDASEVEEQLN